MNLFILNSRFSLLCVQTLVRFFSALIPSHFISIMDTSKNHRGILLQNISFFDQCCSVATNCADSDRLNLPCNILWAFFIFMSIGICEIVQYCCISYGTLAHIHIIKIPLPNNASISICFSNDNAFIFLLTV